MPRLNAPLFTKKKSVSPIIVESFKVEQHEVFAADENVMT